ncbi:MAG: hypothetical protein IJ569_04005 [Prevotella sp.]|nr:hypothetical protein [Prevotella sp.]
MKKLLLISLLIGALPLGMAAQDDDLYFVPKKKSVEKVTDNYGVPRDTYYAGTDRSVDDYNRRSSYYQDIDSTMTDVIDFDAQQGVYPDSLGGDDYKLTKQLSRFEGYDISSNEAFWAGYNAGRYDWGWHSPWYYGRFGWYDPLYYSSWYGGWYDPWYYGYYGWGYPYHFGWRYFSWNYPHYYVGGRSYYRGNTGTMHAGNMNGRVYGRSSAYSGRSGRAGNYSSRQGGSRTGSLLNRSVGGHSSYNGGSSSVRSTAGSRSTSSFGGSSSGGSRGGGSFSGGGGGGRSGGHVGGRR